MVEPGEEPPCGAEGAAAPIRLVRVPLFEALVDSASERSRVGCELLDPAWAENACPELPALRSFPESCRAAHCAITSLHASLLPQISREAFTHESFISLVSLS